MMGSHIIATCIFPPTI